MPRLTRWFARASLSPVWLHFRCFGSGAKGLSYYSSVWTLFPVHMEFLLISWFAQLAMGVAFWIMPRFNVCPSRGKVSLARVSFVLINAGLIIGASQLRFSPAILVGRIFEISAGIVFVVGSWRSVKPHGVL